MSDLTDDLLRDNFTLLCACGDAMRLARLAQILFERGKQQAGDAYLGLAIQKLNKAHEAVTAPEPDSKESDDAAKTKQEAA